MTQEKKPRTYRKEAARDIRVAKTTTAREAIGKIEKGSDLFILTYGQFSLIDALVVILDQVGPADVSIATWTAADAHLERTRELVEGAGINCLRMIVDRSFETRQPGYCHHMRELFGDDCFRFVRSHAKFLLIRSKTHDVVVRTSMNLNENPRLENIEISENRKFAEFFQAVVDSIFSEVDPGEKRSAPVSLAELPEKSPFLPVKAHQIERAALNEPKTSHTVKNR